jgi:tetratricopeptide (TPR) repeat protein
MKLSLHDPLARMLFCGTAYAVAVYCGADTPQAAAAGAAAGAVGASWHKELADMAKAVFSNLLSSDAHGSLAKLPDDPKALLANHDLRRAAGDAIAEVLKEMAQQGGERSKDLKALANAVPTWFPGYCDRHGPVLAGPKAANDSDDQAILSYFTGGLDPFKPGDGPSVPDWYTMVVSLAQAAKVPIGLHGTLADDVAAKLHERFFHALREVIKRDAAEGGKAYPALVLMALSHIASLATGVEAHLKAQDVTAEEHHRDLTRRLETLITRCLAAGKVVQRRVDPAQHHEVLERFKAVERDLRSANTKVDLALRELDKRLDQMQTEQRDQADLTELWFEQIDGLVRGSVATLEQATKQSAAETQKAVERAAERVIAAVSHPAQPAFPAIPKPRAAQLYEPRPDEESDATDALVCSDGSFGVVALVGMAGIGKTYLAERVAWVQRTALGERRLRLALGADAKSGPTDLARTLCELHGIPLPPGQADATGLLAAALGVQPALVLVENVDRPDLVPAVADLVAHLPAVPMLITGRCHALNDPTKPWRAVPIGLLRREQADSLLDKELGPEHADRVITADRDALYARLEGMPLAIRMAAGHIVHGGRSVKQFLEELNERHANVGHVAGDRPADPVEAERQRTLAASVLLSLQALEEGEQGRAHSRALLRLSVGPPPGVGAWLAGFLSGAVSTQALHDACVAARNLGLLNPTLERNAGEPEVLTHIAFHPLVAQVLNHRAGQGDPPTLRDVGLDALTEWFIQRLRETGDDAPARRWREIGCELPALKHWLAQMPDARRMEALHVGGLYAVLNGPYLWWADFCKPLTRSRDAEVRSRAQWILGNAQLRMGALDAALATARSMQKLDRVAANAARDADARDRRLESAALAASLEAYIHQLRGELDEALRIRRDECLPVFERLGCVRQCAVTMGFIADILKDRGELDEALRKCEAAKNQFAKIDDVRHVASMWGEIASIRQSRGESDEALRIWRDECLPVYERLGDVRERAVTMGSIADILQGRGDLDEALRIERGECLPVFERLDDVRERAASMTRIADILYRRGAPEDGAEIERLMRMALANARRLRIPEAGQIERRMVAIGLDPGRIP